MTPPGQLSDEDLALLKRAVRRGCWFCGLSKEDSEDCLGDLHVKLLANDGALVKQFKGLSSWQSYLAAVASNHVKDFVNHLWGRQRPSKEAQRLGPTAIELQRLLVREKLTLDEAIQTLTLRPNVTASRAELEEMAARFPTSTRPKVVPDAELETRSTSEDSPEQKVEKQETASVLKDMVALLHKELEALEPEDRLLLNLWAGGNKISGLAQRLGRDQKSLYGVKDRLVAALRKRFRDAGFDEEQARAVLALTDWPDEDE